MDDPAAAATAQAASSRTTKPSPSGRGQVGDSLRQRPSPSSQGQGGVQSMAGEPGRASSLDGETTNLHAASPSRALPATNSDGASDLHRVSGGKPAPLRSQSGLGAVPSSSPQLQRALSEATLRESSPSPPTAAASSNDPRDGPGPRSIAAQIRHAVLTFGKFVGPGFMISVAYIDPGNYSTDIAAGASYRFRLLFIVLLSNLFAILLQSLCIKLGTVTGLNLAEACRAFLPRWLNLTLYAMAEIAIIATDLAEVS